MPLRNNQETAKKYFLGGDENWLTYETNITGYRNNQSNFFYSEVIVPFRGWIYLDFTGSKFAVLNTELRFPFIRQILPAWPLPLDIRYINGALFAEIGNAWDTKDKLDNLPLPKHVYGGIGFG